MKILNLSFTTCLLVILPITSFAFQAPKPGPVGSKDQLLKNGNFQLGTANWVLEQSEAKGKFEVVKEGPSRQAAARVSVLKVGAESWRIQFYQPKLAIKKGTKYELTYWVKSNRDGVITVNCMQNHEPWEHHGAAVEVPVTKNWKQMVFPFVGPWDDANARITFTNLGTMAGQTYWFAGCALREVKR